MSLDPMMLSIFCQTDTIWSLCMTDSSISLHFMSTRLSTFHNSLLLNLTTQLWFKITIDPFSEYQSYKWFSNSSWMIIFIILLDSPSCETSESSSVMKNWQYRWKVRSGMSSILGITGSMSHK